MLVLFCLLAPICASGAENQDVLAFLSSAEQRLLAATRRNVALNWNYNTNITDYNRKVLQEDKVGLL